MARATQRLYLTADGDVVLHGDVRGVSLLCGAGAEIPPGYSEPAPGQEPEPEKVEPTEPEKPEPEHTPKRRGRPPKEHA